MVEGSGSGCCQFDEEAIGVANEDPSRNVLLGFPVGFTGAPPMVTNSCA